MIISKLGFGGFQLPMLPTKDAEELVFHAYNSNIKFFDTARDYRNSEEIIGRALRSVRDDVFISTKMGDRIPINFNKNLLNSLKKLDTYYIDVYSMQGVHTIKQYQKYIYDIMPLMIKARDNGLIGKIGISTHSIDIVEMAFHNPDIDIYFTPINILYREPVRRLIPLFKNSKKGLVAMKAFGGYKYTYIQGQDSKWATNTKEFDNWFIPELALNYLKQFSEISSILVGFTNKEQVTRDLEAIQITPSGDVMTMCTDLCDNCKKCKCPQGIRIPFLMKLFELYKVYGIKEWTKEVYHKLDCDYTDCTHCMRCECPKHLPITSMLKELHEALQ